MCIFRNERIAYWVQLEGTQGESFTVSPNALYSGCKGVTSETIPTYRHSWPQRLSDHLKLETDKTTRNTETPITAQYAKPRGILTAGAE